MRINDLINNIQNTNSTGLRVNDDLSSVDGAFFNDKNRTSSIGEGKGAAGFIKTLEGKRITGNTYTFNEAKGMTEKEGFAEKLLNFVSVPVSNDKELVKNLTGDDYEALGEEGMSLEKFGKERLERAIERIKDNREFRESTLAENVEKQQEYRESVDRMAFLAKVDSGSEKLIAKMLYEADIPVTEENIAEVKSASEVALSTGKLSDSSESYLIKNNLEPTIDNIYKASHSGEMRQNALDEASWENLKEKAMEIVSEAGTDSEQGLKNARWLVEHDLPVTVDNILYKEELDAYNANGVSESELFKAAVRSMQDGNSAKDGAVIARLNEATVAIEKETEELIGKLSNVGNEAIKLSFIEGATEETVTVRELVEAQENIEGFAQKGVSSELSAEEVNVRIRLEEVRISLNVEAGRRLLANGIDILSDSLMNVSEGLRTLQKGFYSDLYNEVGADTKGISEISAEEAADMALETEKCLDNISNSPLDFYKATFSIRHTVTLAELSSSGELLIREIVSGTDGSISVNPSSMQMALSSYESSSTEVRRDLGDSIKKAFTGSVDSLLSSNGLELTEGNRRAVRILGYNSMEITAESIEEIKFYDAKVTGLIERMTPPVVMTMIRDGINPLESTIDELDAKVSSILNEQGNSLEQKYSEFLVKMEETGSITANERNAYIGIYRLLYNVEKDDGAAIGSLLNSGRELTFGNLMTEARTRVTGVDLAADDNTGISSSHYTNSVTDQINNAFNYQRGLVQDSLGVTDPSRWDRALSGKNYPDVTIEELHDGLFNGQQGLNGTSTGTADIEASAVKAQEIVRTMTANTPASALLNSFGIKDSFNNRKAAEEILSGEGKEDSAISVTADELNDGLLNGSRFDELLGIKTRMANTLTGQAFKTAITAQAAAELNGRVERIEMLKAMAGKGHYRMNVSDGEETKTVNLTVIRNEGNAGTISVEIQKQGYNLQADLNLVMMDQRYNGPAVSRGNLYISENTAQDESITVGGTAGRKGRERSAAFDGYVENIKSALENSGINADNINIVAGSRSSEQYVSYLAQARKENANREEAADNRDKLFTVAKAILSAF